MIKNMEDFLEKNKGWGGQKSTDKKPNQRRSGESVENSFPLINELQTSPQIGLQ